MAKHFVIGLWSWNSSEARHQLPPILFCGNKVSVCLSIYLSIKMAAVKCKYVCIHSMYVSTWYIYLIYYNDPCQVLCQSLAGILHVAFLCCFMWMHLEGLMLFLLVRRLGRIRAYRRKENEWKYLPLIGYGFPLMVVGVSAVVMPDGYGSEQWVMQYKFCVLYSIMCVISY